jgi:hypothetical protein
MILFSKDNENMIIDYEIKNVNQKDNIMINANCFSFVFDRKSK